MAYINIFLKVCARIKPVCETKLAGGLNETP
jgi:hypothetical protein